MISGVDISNLVNGRHLSERVAGLLRGELQKVLAANLGYEGFVAAYDSWTQRIEVLFVRDGLMSWFRMPPSDAGVKQFVSALPVLVTMEPELAEWPKFNRI